MAPGYTNFTSNNYVLSPTIHHVLLQGLLPNTIYYYQSVPEQPSCASMHACMRPSRALGKLDEDAETCPWLQQRWAPQDLTGVCANAGWAT